MKKFKFRYESVLKMRLDAEEKLKNELGALNGKMHKLVQEKEENIQKSKAFDTYIQEQMVIGANGPLMKQFYDGKQYFVKKREEIEYEIQSLQKKIDACLERFKEAIKERKIMEKLKEKAYQDYIDAVNAAEVKVIEEIVNFNNSKLNGDSYGRKS